MNNMCNLKKKFKNLDLELYNLLKVRSIKHTWAWAITIPCSGTQIAC